MKRATVRGVFSGSRSQDPVTGDPLAELTGLLFSSLSRNDQREKASQYLHGLLSAKGRKTMRTIAAAAGDHGRAQSLHHFISSSTWDWQPVRESLARYLETMAPPRAWVVRPMLIPKAGKHSVGVQPRFVAEHGQVISSQLAFGVWFTSEDQCFPVNWALFLSREWLSDPVRRRRAKVPESIVEASEEDSICGLLRDMARDWAVPRRPVVVDAEVADPGALVQGLTDAAIPFIARVRPDTRVVAEPAISGYSGAVSAEHVINAAETLRRPVEWLDPAGNATRTSLVAGVPVRLAETVSAGRRPAASERSVLLLAEWTSARQRPSRFWLTDIAIREDQLLRMAALGGHTERAFWDVADQVGIRDFEGRSFQGWHRHVTLASVAYLAAVQAGTTFSLHCSA